MSLLLFHPSIHEGNFLSTELLWPRTWVMSPCEEGAKFLLLLVPRVQARPPGRQALGIVPHWARGINGPHNICCSHKLLWFPFRPSRVNFWTTSLGSHEHNQPLPSYSTAPVSVSGVTTWTTLSQNAPWQGANRGWQVARQCRRWPQRAPPFSSHLFLPATLYQPRPPVAPPPLCWYQTEVFPLTCKLLLLIAYTALWNPALETVHSSLQQKASAFKTRLRIRGWEGKKKLLSLPFFTSSNQDVSQQERVFICGSCRLSKREVLVLSKRRLLRWSTLSHHSSIPFCCFIVICSSSPPLSPCYWMRRFPQPGLLLVFM